MELTVVICTHNRLELLRRALAYLDRAERPLDTAVEVLVVANSCDDGTQAWLATMARERDTNRLSLRWADQPRLGKSNALNLAITLTRPNPGTNPRLIAFVDDDHRVDPGYLTGIVRAAREYPEMTLFCGRILPDWDGREPAWVHHAGPYRIYPLPVPCFDQGPKPKPITPDVAVPGGGNLFLRHEVFDRAGGFSPSMGPRGHNLGGGEDSDFVLRAMKVGEHCQYVPWVTQYHYVDLERLRFSYLLKKSFQRTCATTRLHSQGESGIPLYLVRKAATYFAKAVFSISWPRTRFFLVRLAATLGEIQGRWQTRA